MNRDGSGFMSKSCHLLLDSVTENELVPTKLFFELIKTYSDESHLLRYCLKCRDCGQLYFYEFKEEIDWDDGDDSQYATYIPVRSEKEADEINAKNSFELLGITPRLQNDHPKGVAKTTKWMK